MAGPESTQTRVVGKRRNASLHISSYPFNCCVHFGPAIPISIYLVGFHIYMYYGSGLSMWLVRLFPSSIPGALLKSLRYGIM